MTFTAAPTIHHLPGASEVAVILGLGRTKPDDTEPYVSPLELWSRLVGLLPRYDDGPASPDAECGRWFEVGVLHRLATERRWTWGVDIFPGPPLSQPGFTAPGIPWSCRPDALGPRCAVEAKSPRVLSFDDWSDDAPPPYYIVQVLAQVAVCHQIGADHGVLAAMARAPGWGSKRTWITYTIHRDEQREQRMVAAVRQWMETYVDAGMAPPPDGSESAERALRRMWAPVDETVYAATATDLERYHRWLQSRDALDEIQGRTNELAQHLKQSMGPATLMVGTDNEPLVTWRARKDGVRTFAPARRRNTTAHGADR